MPMKNYCTKKMIYGKAEAHIFEIVPMLALFKKGGVVEQ